MAADLSKLNIQQQTAILESFDSNVVLLAAAGSGKTSVLTKRTEYLMDDMGVDPQSIMLITFTNKAAKEIVNRVSNINSSAYKMWIGTFHHICTRILRIHGHHMGINTFTIADDRESKKMIKTICEGYGKEYSDKIISDFKKKISGYKSNLVNPQKVMDEYCGNSKEQYIFSLVYRDYQNLCWKQKTFDFDDLIIYTIMLLSSYAPVSKWMHDNIKYVMTDESQDTSTDQYQLIRLLVGGNNLFMTGDINQSIYAFRNAKPEYLNDFQKLYPNSKLLKLETNYRSTQTIISGANSVINNNAFGEKINMVSANEVGERIGIKNLNGFGSTEITEAKWIASEINMLVQSGKSFGDCAIIYRTNIQSKDLEKVFLNSGIPYIIIGSSSFWSSKEMKDVLAYCKAMFNPNDINAFKRVLSTIHGVGKTISGRILEYMNNNDLNCHDVLSTISLNNPEVYKKASATALNGLAILDNVFHSNMKTCSQIADYVINKTTYAEDLKTSNTEEDKETLEALYEIIESFLQFEKTGDDALSVLDQVSLMSDAKGDQKKSIDVVKLMSAHSCKGLEFNTVFISGVEEGLFPHWNALNSPDRIKAIEEERRLFYVAMTRAMKKLYITSSGNRRNTPVKQSRFLKEIPDILIEECF